MESRYIISAQKAEQLPELKLPEIAFMGRSNCGKSSLINALADRKGLARASSTPGRTQMVNFFGIGKEKLIFADLPGYGFNVAPKDIRKLWVSLIETYMQRDVIRQFLFLMDVRRNLEPFEISYINDLSQYADISVVLTKIDKINRSETQKKINKIDGSLKDAGISFNKIYAISSMKKKGIDKLRQDIFNFCES